MAGNTGDNYRDGSVTNRIQVCDPETGTCVKIDTETNKIMGVKKDPYKGVADYTDDRRTKEFNDKINDVMNKFNNGLGE